MTTTTKFGLAQPVRRVEDPRLLKGAGRYTDDIVLPGMLFGVVLRSPHAAANITRLDIAAAAKLPGIAGIYTAADLKADGDWPAALRSAGGEPRRHAAGRAAASGSGRWGGAPRRRPGRIHRRRHVKQARDAAEAIEVDYDILPSITDLPAAMDNGGRWSGRT